MLRTRSWIVGALMATLTLTLVTDVTQAGKPPKTTLPNVRYQIEFIPPPDNANPGFEPEGVTNAFFYEGQWHVQAVDGCIDKFETDMFGNDRTIAVLYDPTRNPNQGIDLNALFPDYIDEAFAVDISDDDTGRGVVVGALRNPSGTIQPFAIDLAIEPLVLDLLPTNGADNAWAHEINENGDILIQYWDETTQSDKFFVFNPGIYTAAPDVRALRTEPRDFCDVDVSTLILPLATDPAMECAGYNLYLNNSAQVLTTTDWDLGLPFPVRYTLGAGPEVFDFTAHVSAINDDGSFCGQIIIPLNKTRNKYEVFRYDDVGGLEIVEGADGGNEYPHDMNSDRDLVTRMEIYRDDWGRWISVNDLVVGTPEDLELWPDRYLYWPLITNRIPIAGTNEEAGIIVGGRSGLMVILTPVPAE